MKICLALLLILCLTLLSPARAGETNAPTPREILSAALVKLAGVVEPQPGAAPQTFSASVIITHAEGLPKALVGQKARLAFQAPDRLQLSAKVEDKPLIVGRDGQELWVYAPEKKFGVVGLPGLPRFSTAPEKKDKTELEPIKLPILKEQLLLVPLLAKITMLPPETNDGVRCVVISGAPPPEAVKTFRLLPFTIAVAIRETDSLPARIEFNSGRGLNLRAQLSDVKLTEPWPAGKWKIPAGPEDKIERTALSHLTRFFESAAAQASETIPTLPPATGTRRVIATEGNGRLEDIDGTRVLFLKGTPEEMGRQHGVLLKPQIREVTERMLYGVGVGSSFTKGRWFFGEIEHAQSRLGPFISERTYREMDALALASGLEKEEVRLVNFFSELFHCSGFALYGSATAGGKMYHGRVLDYLKGVGLEQSATVTIFQPDQGHAWVNVGYAGSVGSVTAMNAKHISIGEMGGRGEGNWDGKPMAQLMREVMEKAATLDEAVAILRRGPRTCEYFYVIADANSRRAVGIAATPEKFEIIQAGESHPALPHAIKDAVLMSAGDRYEALAGRVKSKLGKFDTTSARDLMTRPVCMNSNIHSVLFEPETLDFWVANADSKNVASHTRYTRYNLAELLKGPPTSEQTTPGSAAKLKIATD